MAMKHLETIEAFIQTLINSDTFHSLVVESLPGWGKSTAIDLSLAKCGVEACTVGAYATPLHIYKTICRYPKSVLILDDCAGIFSDQKTMAILKAATWQSSGQGMGTGGGPGTRKPRRVSWGSTSEKVEQATTDFSGKLILLTNTIPSGKETEAFLSRCLSYRIRLREDDVTRMLLDAAKSKHYFPKMELALEVAHFIVDKTTCTDLMKVSLRTLKMGYDLATTHPESWRELFTHLLPSREAPYLDVSRSRSETKEIHGVHEILRSGLSPKEQEERFVRVTGKSRRTFYNYKKRLGLTRPYQSQPS